jgi:hypothetical protein
LLTLEQHLDNLVRHIRLVQEACLILGKKLIAQNRCQLGRILIANGFVHDASKFFGIEWEYLHAGKDVPKDMLELAVKQHTATNSHHSEFWGGFQCMPEIAIAELTCDWYARSQEFGTGLRDWIQNKAIDKFQIDTTAQQYKWLMEFVDLLLDNQFIEER